MKVHDKKGPRMRKGEFSKSVINKELYKKFIKEFPEYKDMTWSEFYNNWLEITKEIRIESVWNPLGVKLGSYLGELKLQYIPYNFEARDRSQNEITNHINLNTRGKVAKVKWERRWAVKFNKILQFYAFNETRDINKLAYEYVSLHPEKLRVARITTGGPSVWRKKIKK